MIANADKRFIAVIWLVAIWFFIVAAGSGCTIRTKNNTTYKFLEKPDKDKQKQDQNEKDDTDKPDDFTELSNEEKDKLSMKDLDQQDQPKDSDTDEPKKAAGIIVEDDPEDEDQPFTVTGRPKGSLPLETRLYAVPATSENMLFDPDVKRRSHQQASLELVKDGISALDRGNIDLAIRKFQKAISVDSRSGYAYFYFARARFLQKDWNQVIALSEKATLLLGRNPVFLSRAYLLKAQAFANQKQYLQALAACESAIDADTHNVHAKLLKTRIKNLY